MNFLRGFFCAREIRSAKNFLLKFFAIHRIIFFDAKKQRTKGLVQ